MTELSVVDSPGASNGAILVVDDHELVRTMIVAILEDAGISVISADSGPAALQIIGEGGTRVSCVLQDLSMPKMRGEDVVAALLELDPHLPVIVMSVDDEATGRSRLNDATIAGYLQKPFDPQTLISKIRSVLASKGRQA